MFSLQPPRHISTLPFTSLWLLRSTVRMSASHPKATDSLRSSEMTLSAQQATYAAQQSSRLFDHLVGADEQHRRDFETKPPGGSQVDHKIEPGRLHDR